MATLANTVGRGLLGCQPLSYADGDTVQDDRTVRGFSDEGR